MKLNMQLVGRNYGPFQYESLQESILFFNKAVDAPIFHGYSETSAAHPIYAACFNQRPFSVALRDPELGLDFSRLLHAGQSFEFFEEIKPNLKIVTEGRIESIYCRGDLEFITVLSESRNSEGTLLLRGRYTGVVK